MLRTLTRFSLLLALAGAALAACSSSDSTLFGNGAGATSGDSAGDTSAGPTGPSSGSMSTTTGGAGGKGGGGGGGQGGGAGGCKGDMDCADAFTCTVDTCNAGQCAHVAGPSVGPTACPAGQFCDVIKGCVPAVACSNTAQCVAKFGGDTCNTDIECDPATSVCIYQTLDKDQDGHPPIVCAGDDCDDGDPATHPGAAEICDGKDNDCDGKTDDGATCGGLEVCQNGGCICPQQNTCGVDCVDTTSDHDHCGSCGHVCALDATCVASKCVCPANETDCSGQCVNLKSDTNNCNGCGMACQANATCQNAACVCNGGLSLCGGQCVDTKTDPNNCNGCGKVCAGVCQGGVCNACPESDLFLMEDVSASTATAANGGTRLSISRLGIESFIAEVKSSGLGLGLGYHPIIPAIAPTCMVDMDCGVNGFCFGNMCDAGSDSCKPADYAVPVVPIALLPGVSAAITGSLGPQMPNGGSPVAIGLQGALMYATTYATANPTHKVGVVLITDGMPNECTPNADQTDLLPIAAQYLAGPPKIFTYVIGLGADVTVAQLNAVAQAGGTGTGFVANSNSDMQNALDKIRDAAKTCP